MSAAYAVVVVVQQIITPLWQQIQADPTSPDSLIWLVPVLFMLMLLARRLPSVSWLGNTTLALLVGVGAAVALLGSLTGTLWPQIVNVQPATPLQGIVIAILTVCTLLAFNLLRCGRAAVACGSLLCGNVVLRPLAELCSPSPLGHCLLRCLAPGLFYWQSVSIILLRNWFKDFDDD